MALTNKEQKPKPLSEKEQELSRYLIMSLTGDVASICSMIDWKNVAKLYQYKDEEIARHQGRKLIKKIAELGKYDNDEATGGDDNEAAESSITTPKAIAGKKRKAAGTPRADDSSTKVAKRGRPTKKVKAEDHLSEAETPVEQEDGEAD